MQKLLAVIAAFITATNAWAEALEPVELTPINHIPAELVIAGPDGQETRYSPATLEELTTYRLRTTTPWRSDPAEFDGILLSDLLRANGLEEVAEIRVTAENDYATVIPRAVWEDVPVLIATRVDGQPHSRRERGPIQFVIPMEAYSSSTVAKESHLVWMAARIEPR
ncbi:molybdopterin-dependent oxidoreductase [Cognatiyoonia sp. IB215182]|uniref:molybdopterin-dependent oxidoreductase n=1 Tax=Cognatiyoonia sp. IB215182 TaxID=3097353 RepID=UPI002A14769D|nr:molybdopterin-dependent oxidoreductase [Cognatiyoonia sp. IB215182]MDX8354689.1 hypothetical protein [Cognatiyoonia sp. IB215182]